MDTVASSEQVRYSVEQLVFDERNLPGRQDRLVFARLATNLHRSVSDLIDVIWGDFAAA